MIDTYLHTYRGVSRGMRADEAKKVCPDICLVHVELIGEKFDDVASTSQAHVDGRSSSSTSQAHVDGRSSASTSQVHASSLRHADKVTLQRYREASAEIFEVLQRFGTVEKASIDEAYIEVTKEVGDEMSKMQKYVRREEDEDRELIEAEWMSKYAPNATVSVKRCACA